jgi:hypothetical protein
MTYTPEEQKARLKQQKKEHRARLAEIRKKPLKTFEDYEALYGCDPYPVKVLINHCKVTKDWYLMICDLGFKNRDRVISLGVDWDYKDEEDGVAIVLRYLSAEYRVLPAYTSLKDINESGIRMATRFVPKKKPRA